MCTELKKKSPSNLVPKSYCLVNFPLDLHFCIKSITAIEVKRNCCYNDVISGTGVSRATYVRTQGTRGIVSREASSSADYTLEHRFNWKVFLEASAK